jgi:hypothetical protein
LLSIVIALATVSFQALKAAFANPVAACALSMQADQAKTGGWSNCPKGKYFSQEMYLFPGLQNPKFR